MLDTATPKGRILAAALECAGKKSWSDVSLLDIAEQAQLQLADLRGQFDSKGAILAGLLRAVDDEVLRKAPQRTEGQEPRDRLFDVIMTRFDVLAPHKAALKSMYEAGAADLAVAPRFLASQHWMLETAGIGTDGAGGAVRVAGLAMVYASVFRVWLEDDDPGLARTMAALDRRLRRGERTVRNVEQACSVVSRFASDAPRFLRYVLRGRRSDRRSEPSPAPETGAV